MILETAVTLVIVFSALVVVHEFGHFLLAKLCGIRVEEFALGFGPRLIRVAKRGDTEYNLRAIPLGGFVKLSGMEAGEDDLPYGFMAQKIWKRSLVIFSGPLFSFLFAIVTFVAVGFIWGFPDSPTTLNRVAMVSPKTEAAKMGLRAGDVVTAINGVTVTTGKEMTDFIHSHPEEKLTLRVDRRGRTLHLQGTTRPYVTYLGIFWTFQDGNQAVADRIGDVKLAKKLDIREGDKLLSINSTLIVGGRSMANAIKSASLAPSVPVKLGLGRDNISRTIDVVPDPASVSFAGIRWEFPGAYAGEVAKDSPLAKSVEYGDILTSVNGKPVETPSDLVGAIGNLSAGKLRLDIKRGETSRVAEAVWRPEAKNQVVTGYFESMGVLGFMPESVRVKPGFTGSMVYGLRLTWAQVGLLVKTLTTDRITKDVGGPVMIAKVTSSSVARGIDAVVFMMGSLSLSLAVVNLIPLPILDGGHLLLLAVEALRRRRLSAAHMQAWQMAGLAVLGVIVVLVLWSDIFKITKGLVPQ